MRCRPCVGSAFLWGREGISSESRRCAYDGPRVGRYQVTGKANLLHWRTSIPRTARSFLLPPVKSRSSHAWARGLLSYWIASCNAEGSWALRTLTTSLAPADIVDQTPRIL